MYLAAQLMPPPNALRNISEVSNISGEYYSYYQFPHQSSHYHTCSKQNNAQEVYLNPVLLPHPSRQKIQRGTSLVVQRLRPQAPNAVDRGKIPGQETRSHKSQLRVCMPQLKIPGATTKVLHAQRRLKTFHTCLWTAVRNKSPFI